MVPAFWMKLVFKSRRLVPSKVTEIQLIYSKGHYKGQVICNAYTQMHQTFLSKENFKLHL